MRSQDEEQEHGYNSCVDGQDQPDASPELGRVGLDWDVVSLWAANKDPGLVLDGHEGEVKVYCPIRSHEKSCHGRDSVPIQDLPGDSSPRSIALFDAPHPSLLGQDIPVYKFKIIVVNV